MSSETSSVCGGFQPSNAIPFNSASGKNPCSLYDYTETSPNLLDNFCPLLLSSNGRWANSGGVQPSISYKIRCLGVEGSHSYIMIKHTVPYLTSYNMWYLHQMIINNVCKVVCWKPIILNYNLVINNWIIKLNFAMD